MIYSVSPKKSGIYIIYVNVEHKKYFKNKMTLAPTGVQTKTSNESDRSDVAASETEDLTLDYDHSKNHHGSEVKVQIPDFVVIKRSDPECHTGICNVVFEVKSDLS